MSNYILNPSFSLGFDYWTNGAGGLAYSLDAGKAKATSGVADTNEKDYRIMQGFSISNTVISGKISVWGQWENYNGDIDGYTKYRIWIQKPDSSFYYPLTLTTKDGVGSGWLLYNYDIASELIQYGNYKLYLQCLVRSAYSEVEDSVQVINNYNTWINNGFVFYDSGTRIGKYSEEDFNEYTATIYKNFTVEEVPKSASLQVEARGWKHSAGEEGQAWLRVRLRDANSNWHTIYNAQKSDGEWAYIVNQSILSYITKAGNYRLELYTLVQSGRTWYESPPPPHYVYYTSYGQFRDVDLTVIWDEDQYTQSYGWLDDINVNIAIKKTKTVLEALGSGEITSKESLLTKSEILKLSENYSSKTTKVFRTVSETVKLIGTYLRKVKKTIKENLGVLESYTHSKLPKPASAFENLGVLEFLFAKRTRGNIEDSYEISQLTDWETTPPQSTQWIKIKTEV